MRSTKHSLCDDADSAREGTEREEQEGTSSRPSFAALSWLLTLPILSSQQTASK